MAVIALQIVVIYWSPVQALFNTTALTPQDWLIAVGTAATILVLEELRKQLRQIVSLTHQKS
jgi:Ca2+-transporting ATPase